MQIGRLFEIVYILLDEKTVTAKDLANRFEISTRTVYRDIEILSSAGIPIFMTKGRGGGISLLPNFTLNKTVFTEGEKSDILMALKATSSVGINQTDTVLKKLSTLFGKANTNWLEVELSSWSNSSYESDMSNELKNAVINKFVICFKYSNAKGENIYREAEPLKLCFKGGSWYLYAFCNKKQDYRFFKLSRIRSLLVLDKTFDRQPSAEILPKDNWKEEYVDLKLKLSQAVAFRVYDEFQEFQKLDDGSFIVHMKMPKGDWTYSYIFSFGEHCEVLEPLDIRNGIKDKFEKGYKKYL